jgi:hypothetical protein
MVPMGPKILSALLVLIAIKYFGRISVWRVARPIENPVSVLPDSVYVVAAVDVNSASFGVHLDQLEVMLSGQDGF